jgi:AraC-like DNA-binding protein
MHSLEILNSATIAGFNQIEPYIRYCAEDRYTQDWVLEPRRLSDYEFIFVTRGEGEFMIEERAYRVLPNDLLLIRPGLLNRARSITLPFSFLCVHFDFYVAKAPACRPGPAVDSFKTVPSGSVRFQKASLEFDEFRTIQDFSFVGNLLRRIVAESHARGQCYGLVVKSLFLELFIDLLREGCNQHAAGTCPPEIESVAEYIHSNYARRIYLGELARHAHLQPNYLSALFKKHMGCPVTDFINIYRIQVAKNMLLGTRKTVEDIAGDVGFYDIHHFSRIFKQHEGLSPAQYRLIRNG